MASPSLFQPTKVGRMSLAHRVVLAPMTRLRSNPETLVPLPVVKDFYTQRASVPGTLLITEGTSVHKKACGYPAGPGIYTDEQIAAWKEIVDAVHAKGSYIYMQILGFGRKANPACVPNGDVVAASAIPSSVGGVTPRALTVGEIEEYVDWYETAARNAVHKAGFDGVEIHCANGYLLDGFLQDTSNTRTDEYGGTIAKRARFVLSVVDRVSQSIGADRVGFRLSPWTHVDGSGMDDPIPTYAFVVKEIAARYSNLAYLHDIEPRAQLSDDVEPAPHESNDFLRTIWNGRPFIAAGGYVRENGIETADRFGGLIAYGRWYTSNPDLPKRLERNLPLRKYDRSTFYLPGEVSPRGYVDFEE
ncbi:FMN-linked oxidoreductase [Cylindrobasidium torrendii FP15055 ss-10]|uniref:FMN-linked oxidoreductase n=1 Tax=Cylindrobasidium torrendii FP15055 ss-10 TaxID=1314674 RepID=A0A0D7B1R3_9AGAR|nr:FMN-linked oxidoreductase [Cylindrobasidium torrendii FP15055 ss-10]